MGNVVLTCTRCTEERSEELPYAAPLSRSTEIAVSKHLCRVSVGGTAQPEQEDTTSSPTSTTSSITSSSSSHHPTTPPLLAGRRAWTWTEGVVALGPSPSGSLTVSLTDRDFPNSPGEDNGIKCLELLYEIPHGIQREYHPSPGRPFTAWTRNLAYLPDNEEGHSLLWRLKWAFSRGLTFSVGYSHSRNEENTVVWTEAFGHKTSLKGGSPYSFPDASYFQKTRKQLDYLGVPAPPREMTTPMCEVIHYSAPDQLPAPTTATTAPTSSTPHLRPMSLRTPTRHAASPGVPDRQCVLCHEQLVVRPAVQLVDYKHAFHLHCLTYHLRKNPSCPIQGCRAPPLVPQGASPSGTMTTQILSADWITITYEIPPGEQLPYHPTPKARQGGLIRYTYLPNTDAGRDVLKRLRYAWMKGLLFKVSGPEQPNPSQVVPTCPGLHRIFATDFDPLHSSVHTFLTDCRDSLGHLGVPEADQCLAPRDTVDPHDTLESQLAFTAFVSHAPLPINAPPGPSFDVATVTVLSPQSEPTPPSPPPPPPQVSPVPCSPPSSLDQVPSASTSPPPNQFQNIIVVLRSEPFVWREVGHPPRPIAKLALDREGRFFESLLQETKRDITLYLDAATLDRFDEALVLRCTILHYSGHGMSDSLPFELNGEAHLMGIDELQRMVQEKNGEACRLAFASCCQSLNVGQAFVAAGVKHVVCCDVSTGGSDSEGVPQGVTDIAAYMFSRSFYRTLTRGGTVIGAFRQACNFVETSLEVKRAVRDPKEEVKKFRLLPDGPDGHNVVLFDNLKEVPRWPAVGSHPSKYFISNLMQQDPSPSPPNPLWGRENAQFEVLNLVLNSRFVCVVGTAGIGCSSVVRGVCNYINERKRTFNDSNIELIYYLKVEENETCLTLAERLLRSVNPNAAVAGGLTSVTNEILRALRALRKTRALVVLYRIHKVTDLNEDSNKVFRSFLECLAREVRVLVTSQVRLEVEGEKVYTLAPLDYGSTLRLFGSALSSSRVGFTAREIGTLIEHLDSWSVATALPTARNLSEVVQDRFALMGSGVPTEIVRAAHNLSREAYQRAVDDMLAPTA